VVQTLYAQEQGNDKALEQFESHLEERKIKGRKGDFARRLLRGVQKYLPEIDKLLKENLVGWDLERLDKVDKQILRLALYEIFYENQPYRIAISEAIKIAKLYSEEKSRQFINGVLHQIVQKAGLVEKEQKEKEEKEKKGEKEKESSGELGELEEKSETPLTDSKDSPSSPEKE
jgi:N utilization substance protein B